MTQTLLDKIWDQHVIKDLGDGYHLLHVDRHLLHDLSGPASLRALEKRQLHVAHPELSFAVPDHCVSTAENRTVESTAFGHRLIPILRDRCAAEKITYFDLNTPEQGIVHVIGPELGLTLPGITLVCGDSHTCTHGAFGTLAWGIGSSEINHVLATQCIIEKKPKQLRVNFIGNASTAISAKDMALYLIARHGVDAGTGHAVEYSGEAVSRLSMEGRMTLCNLTIELGAKIGLIAPDQKTIDYIAHKRYAPEGDRWRVAEQYWSTLYSDPQASFDREITINVEDISPQITWGISPEHCIGIDERIPAPAEAPDENTQMAWQNALDYIRLRPGQLIAGTPIQRVFIGSCANSRLSDLQAAAQAVAGKKVAPHVMAWVVPGSQSVKKQAEALELDKIFLAAGFEWREPGCSQCVATNGEYVAAGERCVSTTNRNFIGRQGPGALTHLASPTIAALSAIHGEITDPRG